MRAVFDALDIEGDAVLTVGQCELLLAPALEANGIAVDDATVRATIAAVNGQGNARTRAKRRKAGPSPGRGAAVAVDEHATALTRDRFVERMVAFRARAAALRREEGQHSSTAERDGEIDAETRPTRNRMRNGFCLTFKHVFNRNTRQVTRHTAEIVLDSILAAVPAVVIGLIYPGSTWSIEDDLPLISFLSFLVLGLVQTIGSVRELSAERLLFYRERKRGLNVCAYFTAKDAMGLLNTGVRASLFAGITYSFLVPQVRAAAGAPTTEPLRVLVVTTVTKMVALTPPPRPCTLPFLLSPLPCQCHTDGILSDVVH